MIQRPAGTFHVLAFLLQGGGLFVSSGGVANLDGCQVYENVASIVGDMSWQGVSLVHIIEPTCNVPLPRWNVRVLVVGRAGDSTSWARQC